MDFVADACSHLITWLKIFSFGSYPIYALLNLVLYVVIPVLSWVGFIALLKEPKNSSSRKRIKVFLYLLLGAYLLFHLGGLLFVTAKFIGVI